jgi:hypothetical protein
MFICDFLNRYGEEYLNLLFSGAVEVQRFLKENMCFLKSFSRLRFRKEEHLITTMSSRSPRSATVVSDCLDESAPQNGRKHNRRSALEGKKKPISPLTLKEQLELSAFVQVLFHPPVENGGEVRELGRMFQGALGYLPDDTLLGFSGEFVKEGGIMAVLRQYWEERQDCRDILWKFHLKELWEILSRIRTKAKGYESEEVESYRENLFLALAAYVPHMLLAERYGDWETPSQILQAVDNARRDLCVAIVARPLRKKAIRLCDWWPEEMMGEANACLS